jgi:hypothetical protein
VRLARLRWQAKARAYSLSAAAQDQAQQLRTTAAGAACQPAARKRPRSPVDAPGGTRAQNKRNLARPGA